MTVPLRESGISWESSEPLAQRTQRLQDAQNSVHAMVRLTGEMGRRVQPACTLTCLLQAQDGS